MKLLPLALFIIAACNGNFEKINDRDGDGYPENCGLAEEAGEIIGDFFCEEDCDDGNAEVNPTATDFCDGIDNNCDGLEDFPPPPDAPLWFDDRDWDGFGDPNDEQRSCTAPMNTNTGTGSYFWANNPDDCNDTDTDVSPADPEVCDDGIDNNCDGGIDENCK